MDKLEFTLYVKPRTKKNHMQLVTLKTGRQMLLPSKQYKEFEKEVVEAVGDLLLHECLKYEDLPINYPINLKCEFYKEKDYKADLMGYLQAIQDALVKAGVLADDNHKIVVTTDGSKVYLDRENPRIEIEIDKLQKGDI